MMHNRQLLQWYLDAGVDEATDGEPVNYYGNSGQWTADSGQGDHPPKAVSVNPPSSSPLHHTPSAAMASARALADNATSLEELEAAVREFDGCGIKKTASKTVFSDGNPKARVMIIG